MYQNGRKIFIITVDERIKIFLVVERSRDDIMKDTVRRKYSEISRKWSMKILTFGPEMPKKANYRHFPPYCLSLVTIKTQISRGDSTNSFISKLHAMWKDFLMHHKPLLSLTLIPASFQSFTRICNLQQFFLARRGKKQDNFQ